MVDEKVLLSYRNQARPDRNKQRRKIKPQNFNQLMCDICASTEILETNEGYVCKTCGIVLEVQKLEYYRPYNEDIIQHAVLGNTQIVFHSWIL